MSSTWWPAAGRRLYASGGINAVGYANYWSSTRYSSAYFSYYLYLKYDGNVGPSDYDYRSYAFSVRCVQERGRASRGTWDVGGG